MAAVTEEAAALLTHTLSDHKTAAVILAAGSSSRMEGLNKQFEPVAGIPVLARTLMAYEASPFIDEIVLVTRLEDFPAAKEIRTTYHISKLKKLVTGGSTRQESAKLGFREVSDEMRYVAIADGARCLVTTENIAKVCLSAYRHEAASAAHLCHDSFKRTNALGAVLETVDRKNLWAVQTPQIFNKTLYTAALEKADEDGFSGTDDNALAEHLGYRVYLEECGVENLKITTREDLLLAAAIVRVREENEE